jgi:hypothetical protein
VVMAASEEDCSLGSSVTKFSKIAMLHVVLDWQTVLEKAFCFILWHFNLLFSFCYNKFEKWHF